MLELTYASCRYDRMEALRSGEVAVDGISLKCLMFKAGRDIFDRMVGARAFEVSELSASEYIIPGRAGRQPVRRHPGISFADVQARVRVRQHDGGYPRAKRA